MDREKITELALAAGFEEKLLANGETGLREYVYAFAKAIEAEKDSEAKEFIDAAIDDARYFESQLYQPQCPRCLKRISGEGIHTCTPTAQWWELEQQRDELLTALEAFDAAAMESGSIIGFAGKCLGLLKKARAAIASVKGGA